MNAMRAAIGMVMIGIRGARHVPEENQNHGCDRAHDLEERRGQRVDRFPDQLGPVVDRKDCHATRQPVLDIPDLRLHPVDHIERIFAVPHHDDPGHRFTHAVEL